MNASGRRVGRVEYLANQQAIHKKLEAGHSAKDIYNELEKAGKITMSYRNFCRYVKASFVVSKPDQSLEQLASPEKSAPQKFTHEKQATAQETAQRLLHGKKQED